MYLHVFSWQGGICEHFHFLHLDAALLKHFPYGTTDAPCASGNRLGNLANIEENWPAVCWQIQAGGPHWKGKQLVNHLPENMQMAANDSGLIDRWLLFAQKNTPGLSKRAKSPQFPENPNSSVMFLLQVFTVQLCVLRFFFFICFHNLT